MKNPKLNLSNDELALITLSLMSMKGIYLTKLSMASSKDEVEFVTYNLTNLENLSAKFKEFVEAKNAMDAEAKENGK